MMKTLQIYFTVFLLFIITNVLGQVQQDGSITIQKLCEDCFDGEDNDGDGIIDCLDPDCEDELFNNLKTDVTKSITNCLSCMGTHRDIIYEYEIKTSESGELLCDILFEISVHEEKIELIAEDKECPSGNIVFDDNGNWKRTDSSDETGIFIEIDGVLKPYSHAFISKEAHENIYRHFLANNFPEFAGSQNIGVYATSNTASPYGETGSLKVDELPNRGRFNNFRCIYDIGLLIPVTRSEIDENTYRTQSTFTYDKCKFLSTMRHELNHMYGQFPGINGDQCRFIELDPLLSHIVIYYNDFRSQMWESATDDSFGDAFKDALLFEPVADYFKLYIDQEVLKGYSKDSEHIRYLYCTYVEPMLSEYWKNRIFTEKDVSYDCD